MRAATEHPIFSINSRSKIRDNDLSYSFTNASRFLQINGPPLVMNSTQLSSSFLFTHSGVVPTLLIFRGGFSSSMRRNVFGDRIFTNPLIWYGNEPKSNRVLMFSTPSAVALTFQLFPLSSVVCYSSLCFPRAIAVEATEIPLQPVHTTDNFEQVLRAYYHTLNI